MFDTLIRDVRVLDGSSRAEYRASVALEGGRIAAIGELPAPRRGTWSTATAWRWRRVSSTHTHDDTNVIRTPGMLPKLAGRDHGGGGQLRHQRLARRCAASRRIP